MIEIADGLVIVQGEDEADWVGHDSFVAVGVSLEPIVGCVKRTICRRAVVRFTHPTDTLPHRQLHPSLSSFPGSEYFAVLRSSTSTSRRKAAASSGGTGLM